MDCDDVIQELLDEDSYQHQAVFSAIEPGLGCHRWGGLTDRLTGAARAESSGTVDDLSGLNTWDFAVMRCEFGDLQSFDSAALIDLYKPADEEQLERVIDLAEGQQLDDSLTLLRSRSDSGYSNGSTSHRFTNWCQSPGCLSCASSSDIGVDSPSPSLLASPPPPPLPQSTPQQQRILVKRATSPSLATRADGVGKRTKKQRTKASKSRQLQLWQFLYQQLDSLDSSGIPPHLHWESRQEGTFRIANPNGLAEAWGCHRRRDNMTYEKMSRTLRYYYDRRLITKVAGKQHTYRFHYDQFPEQV